MTGPAESAHTPILDLLLTARRRCTAGLQKGLREVLGHGRDRQPEVHRIAATPGIDDHEALSARTAAGLNHPFALDAI